MRLRFAALVLLSSALVTLAGPAGALAHGPRHNHGVTIAVTPNPILSGEGVLIYGQLNGPNHSGQPIYLYHRVAPSHGFTLIGTTKTSVNGFYEFTRVEGVVTTNRSWFVRAPGLAGNIHSRTVHEQVAALVSLNVATPPPTGDGYDTNHPVAFTGHVSPNHAGERVLLQLQNSAAGGDDWKTLKSGRLGPGSNYDIQYRFRVPGAYNVRVKFTGDDRNTDGVSDTNSVVVQQTEVRDFTINTSAPVVNYGTSAQITGTLYLPGTTTPDPNVSVTLWAHTDNARWHTVGNPATTGSNGGYAFTVTPANNTVYQVRTTFTPPARRHTALLYEGVRDVVTLGVSSNTSVVGGTVTFQGAVSPDKAGHAIYLERLGADGDYHVAAIAVVRHDSTYSFKWRFGTPGTKQFRVRISGGPENVGGASPAVSVTVALPPVTSLPPAHRQAGRCAPFGPRRAPRRGPAGFPLRPPLPTTATPPEPP